MPLAHLRGLSPLAGLLAALRVLFGRGVRAVLVSTLGWSVLGVSVGQTVCYGNWRATNYSLGSFASASAACAAVVALPGFGGYYSVSSIDQISPTSATCRFTASGFPPQSEVVSGSVVACPVDCGAVASSIGANRGLRGTLGTGSCSAVVTYQGCQLEGSLTGQSAGDSQGTVWGPFRVSTANCTGQQQTAAPSELPPGYCPGTVNGVAVTVRCGTTTSAGPTTSSTAPAGSASAPSGVVPGQSSTSSTTCVAGSCTTTTNIYSGGNGTPGSGTLAGVQTTSQPQGQYCASNRGAAECGGADGDSGFGGACSQGFTCDGDAVQCAVAKEQHERNCSMFAEPDGVSQTYDGLKGEGQADPAFSESVGLHLPTAPAGSCGIGDFSVTILGSGWDVPLGTRICPYMAVIRGVIVSFGMLAFVLIVLRG